MHTCTHTQVLGRVSYRIFMVGMSIQGVNMLL